LEEAVAVIRKLWSGELESHYGKHYTVENARIYTLPDEPPPIMVAASGSKSIELAGRIGDGLIGLAPKKEITEGFAEAGGGDKPRYGQIHVCWADDEDEARRTAHKWWPNTAVPSKLNWELPLPSHFEAAVESVEEDDVAESVVCGPDPKPYGKQVEDFVQAGYDHVYLHQIGPDQEGFLQFYERELQPALREKVAA
jgi:coenzyme F420-dependent glucose-6-phosphate dehydrogenase